MPAVLSQNLSPDCLKVIGTAIDCSVSPFALYDQDFNLVYANQVTREAWPELIKSLTAGAPIKQAIQNMVSALFPMGTEDQTAMAYNHAWSTLRSVEPVTMQAANGRWFEMTHHKIGEKFTAGTGVEITKLVKKETEIKRAQAFQTHIFESLGQGMMVVDKNGTIQQFNETYAAYAKASPVDVFVGMKIKDRIIDVMKAENIDLGVNSYDEWYEAVFWPRFNVPNSIYQEEYTLENGHHFLWRQHYEELVGNIITITDITEIKNAQLKAKGAERAKSEFLANMSHEIRTPMNGVLGMTQLLENCNLTAKQQSFVRTIERSGQALLTIINDILDFSKIEAGQIKLNNSPFNLRDSIEDVTSLLAATAADKDLDILVRIDPTLPPEFMGDVGRYRQIITNILGNAVKFTHEGHVLINVSGDVSSEQAHLKISIEDTGIGIPADQIDHIFDKFRQVDGTKSRQYEGTGLGLSIASQLLGLMGGDISVKSKLGVGTTFHLNLTLPVTQASIKVVEVTKSIKGSTILIIDDNPVNQSILKEQFKNWGCRNLAVESAAKGRTVLRAALKKEISIDLIILDYHMPKETGEEFLDTVKNDHRFSDIPILMLTSVDRNGLETMLKEKGLDGYMTKPPRASLLLAMATRLISHHKNQQAEATPSSLMPKLIETASEEDVVQTKTTPRVSEKLDILVAEDNEVNKIYIDYVLKETEWTYEIVSDGQEAVEVFQSHKPRLILMDVSMPRKNGYEATVEIRALEAAQKLNHTPIIATTAHAMADDKAACLSVGMDDFLPKPLSIKDLKSILEKWGLKATTVSSSRSAA